MRWAFFIDANLEPKIATILSKEGYRAEYSDYVLDEDADDKDDILPYVRQEELVERPVSPYPPLQRGLFVGSLFPWTHTRNLL